MASEERVGPSVRTHVEAGGPPRAGAAASGARDRALRVVVVDERGRAAAAPGLARWLARVAPSGASGVVSVALVSDAKIRALNRQYRHHDRPTDVLSFSYDRAEPHSPSIRTGAPDGCQPFLGDIVIARGVAERQARAEGHSQRTELRVLALHGLLHLLGYDHERDVGAMLRTERRLRRKGGLRAGLVERQSRTGKRAPIAVKRRSEGRVTGANPASTRSRVVGK